jgi:hypothetical protein
LCEVHVVKFNLLARYIHFSKRLEEERPHPRLLS